jgi:hypothetical protein
MLFSVNYFYQYPFVYSSYIFRQSDPTKYLNTTNICRQWFRIVRHNEFYLFKHIMVRKCLLLSQRNNKCKNCIKKKNVNVQLSFLIRDIWAGGKGHMSLPPLAKFKKADPTKYLNITNNCRQWYVSLYYNAYL